MTSNWTNEEVDLLEEAVEEYSNQEISEKILPNRSKSSITHKIRRLGIERPDNFTAIKKIRQSPDPNFKNENLNNFISGFVAGEGSFTFRNPSTRDGKRFSFQISLADVDKNILKEIKQYFEVGNIYELESRDEDWKATVQYQVQTIGGLGGVIIPFFDEVGLYNTHKQKQYNEWRSEFLDYYELTERFK